MIATPRKNQKEQAHKVVQVVSHVVEAVDECPTYVPCILQMATRSQVSSNSVKKKTSCVTYKRAVIKKQTLNKYR